MNTKRFKITLSEEERNTVDKILSENTEDARVLLRAKILSLSDCNNGPELPIMQIAEAAGTSKQTVIKIRNIYHEQGFQIALNVLERKGYTCCATNNPELLQHIKEIISETPPNGRKKWSLRMISAECIKRGYSDCIVSTTVMDILKRNHIQL